MSLSRGYFASYVKFYVVPPPGLTPAKQTVPNSISDLGQIAGYYTFGSGNIPHGFLRAADGTITSFEAGFSTFPTSINAAGAITGSYADASGTSGHNFVRAPGGSITSFDPPSPPPPGLFCGGPAFPTSINGNGVIIGWCFTGVPNPSILGFARFP